MSDQILSRLTVNLSTEAYGALLEAAKITGDERTDVVNRALSLYAFVVARQAEGWQPAMAKHEVIKTFDRARPAQLPGRTESAQRV